MGRINHLAVARDYLERASKLNDLLQKRGISKDHRDFKRIAIWRAHAEKHMASHKDVSEDSNSFTKNMVDPYMRKEEKEPRKGFKSFSKENSGTNDSGEEIQKLSGKKEKIILNPQMRTVQTSITGGQSK
jgi:hypothetical protein